MKKQIKITGKRVFAVLLVLLMVVGILPTNSMGGLFDWSITASAVEVVKSGTRLVVGSYPNVNDILCPGVVIYSNFTTESAVYTNGTKHTLTKGTSYTLSGYYRCTKLVNTFKVPGDSSTWYGEIYLVSVGQPSLTSDGSMSLSTTSFVYNGSTRTVTPTVKWNGNTLTNGTDYTISGTTSAVNVGTYTVTASGKTPYSGSVSGTWKITRASISPTISVSNVTYPNKPSPSVSGNPGNGTVTYYYSTAEDGTYSTDVPSAPGTYWVYATVAQTSNYYGGTTAKKSFQILKADPTVTAPTPINKVYNGQDQTLLNPGATTNGGTMQYSLDQTNWTTSIPTGKNADTYPVYYKVVGNTNYNNWGPKSVNATITKAPISPKISVSDVKLPNQPNPSVSDNLGNGTSTYYYSPTESGSYTTTVPSTPGTYWVYAAVGETTNYQAGETPKKSFNITDADPVKVDPVVTAPVGINKPYNGKDQSLLSTPATTTGGTLQYSLNGTNWQTTIPTGKNIDNYTVYYRVLGDDNYNDWGPQSVPAKITKIDPTVTPPKGIDKPYTGTEQPLLDTPAATTGGTIEYSTDNENWAPEIPKGKDVGDYTVYYRVVGDDIYNSVDPKPVPAKITPKSDSDSNSDSDSDSDSNNTDDGDDDITAAATITVHGIDKKDHPTVIAYKIIRGTYRDGKLTGYVLCDELGKTYTIADKEHPTEDEICAIAAAIRAGSITPVSIPMVRGSESDSSDTVSYTATAKPGLYLVLVSNSNEGYIYNPALVAVNVTNANDIDNSIDGGNTDMRSYFAYPNEAYIKSSKAVMDKNIIINGNKTKGASAGYGETVSFRIDNMTIPSYSTLFGSPTYKITDNLEANAFTGVTNMTVKVDGTAIAPSTATFTISSKDKNGSNASVNVNGETNVIDIPTGVSFEISFASSFLFDNDSKSIVIDYSSVISNTGGYNYSENHNNAYLEYSITPEETNTVKATTYHYSFGISSKIDAEGEDEDPSKKHVIIYEINKVSKKSTEYDIVEDSNGNQIKKNKMALPGAEFTLYDSYNRTNIVGTAVSNEFGGISFTGLKAGIYYLTETNAPDGYTINDTVYRVEITPTFSDIGIMTNYSIEIYVADSTGGRGQLVSTASYTNTPTVNNDGSVTNEIVYHINEGEQLAIINTELARLPSTGGIGTILLTVISSAGMAAFLAMFLINKKKEIKNYFDE